MRIGGIPNLEEIPRDQSWRDAVHEDLLRSSDEIFMNIGRRPTYLAWPYGNGNAAVDSVASKAGFARTLSMEHGANFSFDSDVSRSMPEWKRRQIERFVVTARTSMGDFQRLLRNQQFSTDPEISSMK